MVKTSIRSWLGTHTQYQILCLQGEAMSSSRSSLKVVSQCFVEPHHGLQKPTPPFHLTPYDLYPIKSHFHIQNGLLFGVKPPEMKTLLDNLKSSLSLTLVHFYPVAGRIKVQINTDNDDAAAVSYSYSVDCNSSPGVKFIHASIEDDLAVSDLFSDDVPASVLQSFFLDDRALNDLDSKSLLTVTVVELLDGIFLGCSMNHVVADGNSFCHFLNTWSHIFQRQQQQKQRKAEAIFMIPRPPIMERWFPEGYGPVLKVPFALQNYDTFIIPQPPARRARIFHLSSQTAAKLKAKAIADLKAADPDASIGKLSSFQVLSAFLWRSIAQARNLPPHQQIILVSPVNTRSRLDPPLPADYFGNSVGIVVVFATAGELLSNTLGWAAWKFHQALVAYNDHQVRQWLRDWLRSPSSLKPDEQMELSSVVVNDFTKFDTSGNDFGLGKPLGFYFGNRNQMSDGNVCATSTSTSGLIDLDICLSPPAMSRLLSHPDFMEAVI